MYLKRLEIQGFKTFANRTEFEFGGGVTAIIGPNGSGKSNVADAVRWVLGEQSGRLLRTKKTEDVIFAGSSMRAPSGMAEVTLTLDNSSGWLPLDFSEITVGRRVYRSGESEYYINRGKVRLKDVVDLLVKGNVGHNTYTVIGQGLVDSTLSLRPGERRELIEEAANTKRYYLKIAEARGKLEATVQNLDRARDIVAEIGPRLNRLQKQASQAAEYEGLTRELSTLLTAWYMQSWHKMTESLLTARHAATTSELELTGSQQELANLGDRLSETRELRSVRRIEVGSWQKERLALIGSLDRINTHLAVDSERLESFSAQRRDLASENESLDSAIMAEQGALAEAAERIAALSQDFQDRQNELAEAQSELQEQSKSQAGIQYQLSRLQEQCSAADAALTDAQNRLAQLDERDVKLAGEARRLEAEEERLTAEASGRSDSIREFQKKLDEAGQAASATRAARDKCVREANEIRRRIRETEADLSEIQRERAGLQSQFDTLHRLQESYAGLFTGVRTVLQAAKIGQDAGDRGRPPGRESIQAIANPRVPHLSGVVGIVASLVHVPQHLELAIEVALGGHIQDVIVEKWAHAEEAIELLKATKGGRATFLPLDTIKGGRVAASPNVRGVVGVASELVKFDERLGNVVRQLLGQTIVVEDLAVARQLVGAGNRSAATLGAQLVTLAGEIVRPNGSLTGGALRAQAEGTMLARQRELRQLPEEIRRMVARQGEIEKRLEAQRAEERKLEGEVVELERKERQLDAVRQNLDRELAKLQRELDRIQQERDWQKQLARQVEVERREAEGRRKELASRLSEAEENGESLHQSLIRSQQDAATLLALRASVQEQFNDLRTRLAVTERAMEGERSLMSNRELQLQRLQAQREAKRERLEALAFDYEQVEAEAELFRREKTDIERQVEALDACIEPAVARLEELDAEESLLLAEESQLKSKVLEVERRLGQARLSVQRFDEDLAGLRERMQSEGIDLPVEAIILSAHSDLATQPWQLSMALRGGTALATADSTHGSLQLLVDGSGASGDRVGTEQISREIEAQIAADPAALKRRIDRLRSQLRNMGPVNPSAVDEYEETKQRHDFLDAQIRDLAESEKSLQEGIGLLETQARKQFETVFDAVEKEFKRFFAQLFGGGTAKLVRSDEGENGEVGIDIVAQPPGKRLQNLSSLSGGERALTATALLFAVLEVNPAPFCVLDEVDAALDEANVGRFTGALRQLAQRTQFAVITHNRGTVELADTVYGISMGPDSVSKILSLKLEEVTV